MTVPEPQVDPWPNQEAGGSDAAPPLLIIGASARAAAFSARRAGFEPIAIDLFADRDLRAVAQTIRIRSEDYPGAFPDLARQLPHSPFVYTGALENHPRVVDALARERPFWGIGGDALRAVRDPFRVAGALHARGLPVPELRESISGLLRDGRWIVKPWASAAGRNIDRLTNRTSIPTERHYVQEWIEGLALSGIFVADRTGRNLLGVTRQSLGKPGSAFAYRGSVGPWPLKPDARARLVQVGEVLASEFGLRGLFGVDFVLRDGLPWPVEVNPRYTASVEILERATGMAVLARHAAAFGAEIAFPEQDAVPSRESGNWFHAKSVVYARAPFRLESEIRTIPSPRRLGGAALADLPEVGTEFAEGDPILTIFARGRTLAACQQRIDWMLARITFALGADGIRSLDQTEDSPISYDVS